MSCLYIRVVYSYLSSYNSISMPILHVNLLVGEGGGGGGLRGGGSKYYGHYKMTPPQTAEYKMLPRLPCLYI